MPAMFNSVVSGITDSLEGLPTAIENLPVTVLGLVDALATLPGDLGSALAQAIPQLVVALARLVFEGFILGFRIVVDGIGGILHAFGLDLSEFGIDMATSLVDQLINAIAGLFDPGAALGTDLRAGKGEKQIAGIGIPFFESGGEVTSTGLAYVHEGERVINRSENQGGGGGGRSMTVNIGQVVANNPRQLMREIQRMTGSYGLNESTAALVGS